MLSLPDSEISAFSIIQPKQVQFALFKTPWLDTLIESLLLDSHPSRQLEAGPQQRREIRISVAFEI